MSTDAPPILTPTPVMPTSANPADVPAHAISFIRPAKGWQPIEFAELWRFRELFWIFAERDIKVRYKQTILGVGWALLQPIAFTAIGLIVFGFIAKAGTDNVKPAVLFYLVSQLPWMLFNTGLQASAMSLVGAQNMIKKIYFPRLVIPTSAVVVSVVDFLIQLAIVVVVLLAVALIPLVLSVEFSSYVPPWQIVLLPLAALWAFVAALSIGLPLSALNVEYRDVRYVIPFVTQFMIFAAPVFWSVSKISPTWQPLYALLPVVGPIDFFRWCVLDTPAHPVMWLVGVFATVATLTVGLFYFKRMENTFADVV
jgi:lipopolysaccharide transport system permease protein